MPETECLAYLLLFESISEFASDCYFVVIDISTENLIRNVIISKLFNRIKIYERQKSHIIILEHD